MKSLLIHIHKTFNLLLIISNIFVVCENSGYGSGDIIEQPVLPVDEFIAPTRSVTPALIALPDMIAPPAIVTIYMEDEWKIVEPVEPSQHKVEVQLSPVTPASQHGSEVTLNRAVRLCGYPAYCDHSMCRSLNVTSEPIYNCEKGIGIYVFACVVFLLSLVIVLGNSLLPLVIWRSKDMRTRYNYIKVSLAFADMIMGLLLLFSVIPNLNWVRNSTESMIIEELIKEAESRIPTAIIAGSMLTFTAQASILHLSFMSLERFIAIKWPLWHRRRRTKTILLTIAGIWIVSLLFAFAPAVFPRNFSYSMQLGPLVYMLSQKYTPNSEGSTQAYSGPMYAVITMVLPYVIMVVSSITTGVIVWRKMKISSRYRIAINSGANNTGTRVNTADGDENLPSEKKHHNATNLKTELVVFKTLAIMIIAFSLTTLPVAVVFILFNSGYYTCDDYTLPFTIAFYACVTNSFINIIIYTARDNKFRAAVATTFHTKTWRLDKSQTNQTHPGINKKTTPLSHQYINQTSVITAL